MVKMSRQQQDSKPFDEIVKREVKIYKHLMERNRMAWKEINKEDKEHNWLYNVFMGKGYSRGRYDIPPALPSPLPFEIELRAIQLGLL